MPIPDKRSQLENRLRLLIRKAEEQLLSDPDTQKMMTRLRNYYLQDKEGFLDCFSQAPPATKIKRIELPSSNIPQLLYFLDKLKKAPSKELPDSKISKDLPCPNTTKSIFHFEDSQRQVQHKNQIDQITAEINKLKELYKELKKVEPAIHQGKGTFVNPTERLKYQRLLREIPGKIFSLNTILNQLEEENKRK